MKKASLRIVLAAVFLLGSGPASAQVIDFQAPFAGTEGGFTWTFWIPLAESGGVSYIGSSGGGFNTASIARLTPFMVNSFDYRCRFGSCFVNFFSGAALIHSLTPASGFAWQTHMLNLPGVTSIAFGPLTSGGQGANDLDNFSYSLGVSAVPEPASMLLLGTGLAGLLGAARRRRRATRL